MLRLDFIRRIIRVSGVAPQVVSKGGQLRLVLMKCVCAITPLSGFTVFLCACHGVPNYSIDELLIGWVGLLSTFNDKERSEVRG